MFSSLHFYDPNKNINMVLPERTVMFSSDNFIGTLKTKFQRLFVFSRIDVIINLDLIKNAFAQCRVSRISSLILDFKTCCLHFW